MEQPFSKIRGQVLKNLQTATRVSALQTDLMATYTKQISQIYQNFFTVFQKERPHRDPWDFESSRLGTAYMEYLIDLLQRQIIFWDVIRQRGDNYRDYIAKGQPPILAFEYKLLADGRTFERRVNYGLIEVLAPPGMITDKNKRPFIIVDPRSGHGPGISGFKEESQVGQALLAGHPVYCVIFFPEPEAQQTLFDIAAAEEHFLRLVTDRHPQSPKPCIIGNCQGGWAILALAAVHPELAGVIIANGVPLAYWAGQNGKNPLRYLGGLLGGTWLVQQAGDLGNGKFDGANLMMNFDLINPAVSCWKKYYDLFSQIDGEKQNYLDLERWMGGFTAMNTREIRAIADNLFMGNKLVRGKIPLNRNNNLDLRNIRTPLIIFCSQGDEVVPPEQALHWITDVYSDVLEMKLEGQVIVYLIHQDVGHFELFMSSEVAKKEHRQLIDFLNHIEHLPPGLYEMTLHEEKHADGSLHYHPTLEERSLDDIKAMHEEPKLDNQLFDFVHSISNCNATAYDLWVSPWIRAWVQEDTANWLRQTHPLRVSRSATSTLNPLMQPLEWMAPLVEKNRRPASPENPFLRLQQQSAESVFKVMNAANEGRDAYIELLFHWIYGSLYEFIHLESHNHLLVEREDSHEDDENTQNILSMIGEGGLPEAVIRILLILIKTQGFTKAKHLSNGISVLRQHPAFSHFNGSEFRQIVQNQTVIVEYDPELALNSLPQLLKIKSEKTEALALIRDMLQAFDTQLSDKIRLKTQDIQAILASG